MELMEKTLPAGKTEASDDLEDRAMAIYGSIRDRYEPKYNGKFLVIDTESKRVFMGETMDEAIDLGEKVRRPGQVFFVLRIGYAVAGYMYSLIGQM